MSGAQLLNPISGEVDADGRLVTADDALARLNERAGGRKNELLAVPAIKTLALLAIKLQMKLSRAVRVADDAENLELWIEIDPEPNKARLSIISWRVLPEVRRPSATSTPAHIVHDNVMKFDPVGRLVRATGEASHGLMPPDFGRDGNALLTTLFEAGSALDTLLTAMSAGTAVTTNTLKRLSDGVVFRVTGGSVSNGFELKFERVEEARSPAAAANEIPAAGALFGKNLAPVLRQPLGRIIANAETIGSELQGPIRENYALYARDIANAARHLSALVDDLGDLEAVERPDFKAARDNIELGDVARRVAGLLALKAADHRISVHTPPEDLLVPAVAEFRRTLQIILNLVNNAIRYSPDGTSIFIDICTVGAEAFISVRDQGKGIDPADQEKIFEKFERLGRSGDGGSGLGLYISRRLARAMGGELHVQNAEDGGAIFTLRLPNS
ncbi:MAG: hypothetical protein C0429_07140 [Sphingopyxis sp.]|nr:hypothetical protein [Sphingopyxis sp.]